MGDSVEHQSCGGHSTGETPSNIPNLEAKPGSADGTATDRLWESRTPPQHTLSRRASSKRMGSFAYQAQPFLAGRARSSEESQRCGTMGLVSDTISLGLHSYTRTIHAASLTAPALAHCIGVHTRIGNEHADRLLTYPRVACSFPIRTRVGTRTWRPAQLPIFRNPPPLKLRVWVFCFACGPSVPYVGEAAQARNSGLACG